MKYIIMAGGPARRWNNYNNTTKHLIKIGNETMLERIVRQLKDNNVKEIFITANNPLYEVEGAIRNELIYDNKVYNMFYYKYLDEPVTFLYGDTYYTDDVIKKIVNSRPTDILFFGTKDSIIGIKIKDHAMFKKHVEELRGYEEGQVGWKMYRKINNLPDGQNIPCQNFRLIKEHIVNINTPRQYKELVENNEEN